MNNLITVGLTAYNCANFFDKTIASLLSQTEKNIQIIVSDDCSTDSTEEICKKWQIYDSRVKYFRQTKNLGPRENFKFVLDLCETEYFMWASHDDYWSPNFIEECIKNLNRFPQAGFVVTRWIVKSRTLPFVRRLFLPNMSFVSNPDPIYRMLTFTALPFNTFKDNLTYGVWRCSILNQIMAETKMVKYFSIGGSMNEYSLLVAQGIYISNASFVKRYKYFPPGIFFEKSVEKLRNLIIGNQQQELYPKYSKQDHINDLKTVLKLAKVDDDTVEKAVNLNLKHY